MRMRALTAAVAIGSLLVSGAWARDKPAQALVGRKIAKRTLLERKACKLAIGLSPAGREEIESRVICVAEIVKDGDTIDEDLGCSVVLYDLETTSYRAGKSNLRIATNRPCDTRGLAQLDPKPFARHALREGITSVVLHSESDALRSWWETHLRRMRAELPRPAPARPSGKPASKKKGGWKYDGKSQFEGI